MKVPFWEETYKDDNVSTFGIEPNATILEYEPMFKKTWNILDIGTGDGKNALYLARRGFVNVDAFDLSENAIAKLHRIAARDKIQVNAWVEDLRKFDFKQKYDLIFSFGTLHFVEKEEWIKLLRKAKEHTNIGGLNVIQLFTNSLPATPDISEFAVGLANDREIEELYRDWNILQFKSYFFEDEHPGVPKHYHASNKIVAQRMT